MRSLVPAFLLLAPAATAQLPAVYVCDEGRDPHDNVPGQPERIWRCADLNADGDYDDASEIVAFYDETAGPFALQDDHRIVSRPDGTVFVVDRGVERIFAFRDANGDGDANDAGESRVFFDGFAGANGNGLEFDPARGVWFVATSDSGTGSDAILRLVDTNGDGDANDAGEASEYLSLTDVPGTDSAHPRDVAIGPDGRVYYLDTPNILPSTTGIYRLDDLDQDGDANDPGERTPFFVPPMSGVPYLWSIELGMDAWFYTVETTTDVVWRFRDLNLDGDALDPGESSAWWTIGASSFVQDITAAADGSMFLTEAAAPQRIHRVYDQDHNGVVGAGESIVVYDGSAASTAFAAIAGIDIAHEATLPTPFCFGDGFGAPCPCNNSSGAGNLEGCLNSLGTGGALSTTGTASIANDTLVLTGARMPDGPALYFQGTAFLAGGIGIVFGDGLRCVGGTIRRLGLAMNAGGSSSHPGPGDPSISMRGLDAAGDARVYQVWYRNAASYCTASTFNLTNGITLTWGL
jgi:hypothetical protein